MREKESKTFNFILLVLLPLLMLVVLLIIIFKIVMPNKSGNAESSASKPVITETELDMNSGVNGENSNGVSQDGSFQGVADDTPRHDSDSDIFTTPFEDGYVFPNLSDYDFVFIGDSIFDMNNSATSMPRQLEVYTSSRVYNLSNNGSCAGNSSNSYVSLCTLAECFADRRGTGFAGNKSFNEDIVRFANDDHGNKKLVVVINHCVNDYIFATPVANSKDLYDKDTYEGALRTSISRIKAAYPSAYIIYMEPYILGVSDNGNEVNSYGYVMDDYIAALESVAGEYGVMCFNLRAYAFFAEYRDGYLLSDGLHPNEMCSKTMARLFCDFIANQIK